MHKQLLGILMLICLKIDETIVVLPRFEPFLIQN